jgi:hypothetical protein
VLVAVDIDVKRAQKAFAYIALVPADFSLGQQILTGKQLAYTERGSDVVLFFLIEAYTAFDVL